MGKYQSKPKEWPLYHSVPLPLDKNGFTKSFNLQNCNPQEVKQFYDNYGIVVFENILNQNQSEKTIDDLWNETKTLYETETFKIDRKDPKTWQFQGFHADYGFVGDQPLITSQIWENRANPKIYEIFKSLYELTSGHQLKQPLIACFDRGSMMRPSKLDPSWQTDSIYHFDIDPWYWCQQVEQTMYLRYNDNYKKFKDFAYMLGQGNYMPNLGYTKLAGVLALSDTNQESGGFEAALGFQNYIKKWCQKTNYGTRFEKDEQLINTFQKVFMRKGSLMIFSRQLPHNIYPNKSQNFRYAQYLRMTPQSTLCLNEKQKTKRKNLIHPLIPQGLQKTQIVKQIFMLE